MKEILLNDNNKMPSIGFGTYKADYSVILDAIKVGYRLLDTAKVYKNEEEVGRAVKASGVAREEFFITSKLDRNMLGYESAKSELDKTLERLSTDYLDLYLLHWPRADFGKPDFDNWKELDIESWKALCEMKREGKIKSIGVSNFLPHHLDNLLLNTDTVPCVNQLELHIGYTQPYACEYCRNHGIALQAWSPTARGRLNENELVISLAEKYKTTVTHLMLAFLYREGICVIPKSSDISRMKENLTLDDIVISKEDMHRIRTLPETGWGGEHPDFKRVYF